LSVDYGTTADRQLTHCRRVCRPTACTSRRSAQSLHNFCRTPGNTRFSPELQARRTRESEHLHDGAVTALATDVFVGDPARFPDGKAVARYVGMIPRVLERQTPAPGGAQQTGQPVSSVLVVRGGGPCRATGSRPAALPSTEGGAEGMCEGQRRGGAEAGDSALDHVARSKSTTRNSAVVAWRGSRKGGVCAGVPVLALVLVRE